MIIINDCLKIINFSFIITTQSNNINIGVIIAIVCLVLANVSPIITNVSLTLINISLINN